MHMTYRELKRIAQRGLHGLNACWDYGGCLAFANDRKKGCDGGNSITVIKDTGETCSFANAIMADKVTREYGIPLDFKTGEPKVSNDAEKS